MAFENPSVDPDAAPPPPPASTRRRTAGLVTMLLLPVLVVLAVPTHDELAPRLAGVPFFFWSQLACVLLAASCLTVAAALTRATDDDRGGAHPGGPR